MMKNLVYQMEAELIRTGSNQNLQPTYLLHILQKVPIFFILLSKYNNFYFVKGEKLESKRCLIIWG